MARKQSAELTAEERDRQVDQITSRPYDDLKTALPHTVGALLALRSYLERITSQKWIVILTVIVFLPLISVSRYNLPSASDDLCYSRAVQDFGFIGAQIKHYTVWSGRYASTAAISLATSFPPWSSAYKILPILLFVLTFAALFLLLKVALTPLYQGNTVSNFTTLNLSLITIILLMTLLPSATEGIYWVSGAITYQGSFILLLLGITLGIALFKTHPAVKTLYTFLLIVVTVTLVGFNEIAMVISLLLSGIFVVYALKQKENRFPASLIFLASVVAAYVVVKSPGNAIRLQMQYDPKSFFPSLHDGCIKTFQTIAHVLKSTNFWLLGGAFLKFLPTVDGLNIKAWWIWFVGIFTTMIVAMGVIAPAVLEAYVPFRTIDLLTEIFIIGSLLTISLIFYAQPALMRWIENIKTNTLAISVMFCLMSLNIIFGETPVSLAYSDLISGRAKKYAAEITARYDQIAQIQQSADKNLVTPQLKTLSKILYFDDITNDPDDWQNRCTADYFKITTIKVE